MFSVRKVFASGNARILVAAEEILRCGPGSSGHLSSKSFVYFLKSDLKYLGET